MHSWTQKTSEERKKAKTSFLNNWVFKVAFPLKTLSHFEKTKSYLMNKIFATNHITCHTLPDYYLDKPVADAVSERLLHKIVNSRGKAEEEDMEKLKNSICEANSDVDKRVKWFLNDLFFWRSTINVMTLIFMISH